MATLKQTQTSSDIGKEPDIDSLFINPATEKAASIYANPMQLLGGLPKPSMLQTAAHAGLAGIRSGMAMPTASPEASALTGILTGITAGPAYEQQFREQQMANIDMLPIEQVSPSLVEAFPEARGIPLGIFQKLSGIFSAMGKQEKTGISIGTAQQLKVLRPDLTDEQILSIDELTASKYVLKFTKEGGRMERMGGDKITADDPMLPEYAKTLKVPAESLLGKDNKVISTWYGRIKTRQERVSYSEPKPILNEDGDVIGFYQTSTQGKVASTTMPLAAGASQKEKDLSVVNNIMVDLFNTVKGFEPESGPIQRLIGLKESLKAKAGLAPEKQAYMASLDSFLGNLSREYSGERGVLTDQDVSRIKAALPSLYDTEEEIDFKLKQVLKVIAERQKAITGGKLVVPGMKDNKPKGQPKSGGAFSDDAFDKFMGN